MKQDLMKQKNDKKLRSQSIWTVVSLVVAFLLLAFLFLMSRMYAFFMQVVKNFEPVKKCKLSKLP